jgi:hypothetical protein
MPIVCIRSFPHDRTINLYGFPSELKRISYQAFVLDFESGTMPDSGEGIQFLSPWSSGFSQGFGPLTQQAAPVVVMRYSKDGGNTWSNNRPKEMISAGHYRTMMRWRGLGLSRDMIFEVAWSAPMATAINGAFVDLTPGGS